VLAGILWRALVLIGSGIVAGNSLIVMMLLTIVEGDVSAGSVPRVLLITSTTMLTAGLLGCVAPARRALRINPTEALKEA
jgi:ABC-type antimicrobial peptide transport system permease subunit